MLVPLTVSYNLRAEFAQFFSNQDDSMSNFFLANGVRPEAVATVCVVHRDEASVLSVHGDTDREMLQS
jgi:hypothetical protein